MSKETDQTFAHDYDGIQEFDNPMPRWWVWLFIGSVIAAIIYVPYYHYGPGKLPTQAYEEDMAAYYAAHPPIKLASAEELEQMLADDTLKQAGKLVFDTRCAPCHAMDGGGLVGPNLTDDFALHGYGMESIVKVVVDGVPDKGMIPWKSQLKLDESYAVSVYVHELRGNKAANPKAPQGDPIVP